MGPMAEDGFGIGPTKVDHFEVVKNIHLVLLNTTTNGSSWR